MTETRTRVTIEDIMEALDRNFATKEDLETLGETLGSMIETVELKIDDLAQQLGIRLQEHDLPADRPVLVLALGTSVLGNPDETAGAGRQRDRIPHRAGGHRREAG